MWKVLLGLISHGGALGIGFALGIYMLPIITAPESPDSVMLEEAAASSAYQGELSKDLRGSDFLHWGEGVISLSATKIVHQGELAPGPDYKLYLVKEFVENEEEFLPLKADSIVIGDVKTFDGFHLSIPPGVTLEDYTTILIWCESFGEFITAAQYRS